MRVMLHICCAPDATIPVKELKAEGWQVYGYFHGSNIHPEKEVHSRIEALKTLAMAEAFPFMVGTYRPSEWLEHVASMAEEPERGKRCAICFELQLRATVKEAGQQGCTHLCSTLSISPHKDVALISRLGTEIALESGLLWLNRVWRKANGFLRSIQRSRELGLYRQNYCGCLYSRRHLS